MPTVDQLTKDARDMSVLVRNLKEQEHSVSLTAHAPVLLMPTLKFMRAMLEIEKRLDLLGHLPCVQLSSFAFL